MKSYQRLSTIAALMSGAIMLTGASASALPLTAGAKEIASRAEGQGLTTRVQARRNVRAAPRAGSAPRVIGRSTFAAPRIGSRPIVRSPRVAPRFARRRAPVIIGISPFYYDPFPYDYDPYGYYEAPYDGAIAYCIQRFRSYDVRTRTYLGYDGRRHPCP